MWFNSRQEIGGSTRRRYRTELDRYVLPKFGDRTINSISEQMVEEWVVELREGCPPRV
ncbi:tyrosine-type recombinase/integrase [Rathayibacter agropyri]